jgi:hypothetical protein
MLTKLAEFTEAQYLCLRSFKRTASRSTRRFGLCCSMTA